MSAPVEVPDSQPATAFDASTPSTPEGSTVGMADGPASSPAVLSWADWGKVAFIAMACSTIVAVGYHMFIRSQIPLPIATVDLQSVVEAKELQFTDIVTRPGATDADRERAYQLVARLGGELETAVNELRNDCKCLVLVRAAVVGTAPSDLTPALRQRMGVAEVDVASLRARLRETRMGPASSGSPTGQPLSELLGSANGRAPR